MTAFVTGASGGIGSEICRTLCKMGYNVAAAYNHDGEGAGRLAKELGEVLLPVHCDVTDRGSINKACAKTHDAFGEVSLLVNNAGSAYVGLFTDMSEEEIDRVVNVNLVGAMLVSQAFLPDMIRRKNGCIINISSMWGEVGASCEVVYSAAKAGLIGFTKALAKEEGLSGIRVNCIAAGLIDTPMNAMLSDEDVRTLLEEIPLSRVGRPFDVAQAVGFLAGDNSSYITGAVLNVNGGMCM